MYSLTAFVLIKLFALVNSQSLDFTAKFDSPIYVCSDEESQGFVDTSEVVVKRYNESVAAMNGVVKFLKGFKDETIVELILERDVGGAYESVTSYEICDLCEQIDNSKSIYRKYLNYFGFPEHCPFEPNSYPIDDLVLNKDDVPPAVSARPGYYQVTLNLFQATQEQCEKRPVPFIACVKLDIVIDSVE